MKHLYIILLSILIFGCAKEEIDPSQYSDNPLNGLVVHDSDGELQSNVMYDRELSNYLDQVSDSEIIISNTYQDKAKLKVGETIVFGVTDETPEGLIAKIQSVEETDDRLVITYSQGGLNDVFKRLNYNISYHNTSNEITKREFAISKEVFGILNLEIEGTPATVEVTPEFGMNYEFVGIFDIDFENNALDACTYGYKNVEVEANFNAVAFGHATGTGEIESPKINLPPIELLIVEVPVVINSRVSVIASTSIGIQGGFDLDASMVTEPFDAVVDFGLQYDDGWDNICIDESPCDPQFEFDLEFNDIQGAVELTLAKQYAFQFTMYGLYDLLSFGVGLSVPSITFGTELLFEDEEVIAKITGEAAFPIEVSAETEVFDVLIDAFTTNGIATSAKVEFPTVQIELFDKEFPLPCNILFSNSEAYASCEVGGSEDMISLEHGLLASGGSEDGYKLNVDGYELGTFSYGAIHTTTFPANQMSNRSSVQMRDADNPGCRLVLTVTNPCDKIAYCEDSPITDTDGQEYCYQTLADGRRWTNTSLLTSSGETIGLCHGNDPNKCIEIGRYYRFDEANIGLCPSGWRVPTKDEWKSMLDAEFNTSGTGNYKVKHLLAPNLINFGNVPTETANGFNLLPSGMYQGWKLELPPSERFTGSVFDEGTEYGYLWTSSELEGDDASNEFSDGGAWALVMYSSGQYGFKKMSKKAGLVCRCIEN